MNKKIIFKFLPKVIIDILDEIETKRDVYKWKKSGNPIPPPHAVKRVIIREYQKKTGYKSLIETGTFLGDMIFVQMNYFDSITSIELSEHYYTAAKERFKNYPKVHLYQGDSAKMLNKITTTLVEPAIFWLDGHYSGGLTAQGESQCPIFGEFKAILPTELKHVLLIDDARLFTGEDDYPTMDDLKSFFDQNKVNYNFEVKDDVIRFEFV